ncbi:MAG: transglycosylase domain-containing protein [Patescibacteria group bacterium]
MQRGTFGRPGKHKNTIVFAASVCLLAGGLVFLWTGSLRVPDLGSFEGRRVLNSTKIYDRTGKILLYDVHNNIKRTVIPLEEMGSSVQKATVAIEDRDFYKHGGVRLTSIIRAVIVNIFKGSFSQGGSTITQQVIKNALLTQDKKVSRKIKEWVLAVKLERTMSKDDILALYLNEAPYGGNIYGVSEAAQFYFGKTPKELSVSEAAYLAALPKAPTYYSPYGENRKDLDARKNLVLEKMKELGFITDNEYNKSVREAVDFIPRASDNSKALHFVMFVRKYLEEKYGREAVENGLKVTTTLDYDLQKIAEEKVKKYAEENQTKFNASNASLVAIDPKTGQILVMVGSRDYFNKDIDGSFNVSLAHRQPGSAFKPIVYATAFMKGYTPETVLFDLPTEFQTTCTPDGKPKPGTDEKDCYMPENYDGKYRGPINLRNALAQSINIPAIKTLYLAGLEDSLKTASSLGIKSLGDKNRYGLTLVLGGGEVSLLDLTSAYGVFANNGVRNPHEKILKIEDSKGNILEEWRQKGERVIPESVVFQINDILSDNIARAPTFGDRSALYFPGREVAVKTGTTNDYRDAWVLGYTPSLVAGAWVGNNDNTPMEKKVAGFIVAPLWNEFMNAALAQIPKENFERTKKENDLTLKPVLRGVWWGGESYIIDKISGKLATANTPRETMGELVISNPHSILYWVNKKNPLGSRPDNPEEDPQFDLWEYPISKWLLSNKGAIPGVTKEIIPSLYDDVHTAESAPKITIIEPLPGRMFRVGDNVRVVLKSDGKYPLARADFFLNNNLIGSSFSQNNFSFTVNESASIEGENELKVVAYDSVYNNSQEAVVLLITNSN